MGTRWCGAGAARPRVRGDASPEKRFAIHDLARKAAVRGAAWATPTVRGSVRIDRAERIGLAMRSTLTGRDRPAVDLEPAGQLAPAPARDLGQGQQLAPLSG